MATLRKGRKYRAACCLQLRTGASHQPADRYAVASICSTLAVLSHACVYAGAGADPNATDLYGRTPLHYSAHANSAVAFTLVAEAGGNLDYADVEGAYLFQKTKHSNPNLPSFILPLPLWCIALISTLQACCLSKWRSLLVGAASLMTCSGCCAQHTIWHSLPPQDLSCCCQHHAPRRRCRITANSA